MQILKKLMLTILLTTLFYNTLQQAQEKPDLIKRPKNKTEKLIYFGQGTIFFLKGLVDINLTIQDASLLPFGRFLLMTGIPFFTLANTIDSKQKNEKISVGQKLELAWLLIADANLLFKWGDTLLFVIENYRKITMLNGSDIASICLGATIGLTQFVLYALTIKYAYNILQKETKLHEKIKNFAEKVKTKSKHVLEKLWPSKNYVR